MPLHDYRQCCCQNWLEFWTTGYEGFAAAVHAADLNHLQKNMEAKVWKKNCNIIPIWPKKACVVRANAQKKSVPIDNSESKEHSASEHKRKAKNVVSF